MGRSADEPAPPPVSFLGARDLLLDIARCPIVERCLNEDGHPCSTIVHIQSPTRCNRHVPEPWSGRITQAPILFVSSNPSINHAEVFPSADWQDDRVVRFFEGRFDGCATDPAPIIDGARTLRTAHSYGRPTHFLSWARNRAAEILARPAAPGGDYALTEIVRCKSVRERGVDQAVATCVSLYLTRTLETAAARVIVTVGRKAHQRLASAAKLDPSAPHQEVEIGGRHVHVVALGHPSSGAPKTFSTCLSQAQLEQVRSALA